MTKRQNTIEALSKENKKLQQKLYGERNLQNELLHLAFKDHLADGLYGGIKNKGKEYGYYHSGDNAANVIANILDEFSIDSIIDLGCGAGLVMRQVQASRQRHIKIAGVDNEKLFKDKNLFDGISNIKGRFILKDLTKLEKADISEYGAIYMYEPIRDSNLAKKFVERLNQCTMAGQLVIYYPAGSIGKHMEDSLLYENLKTKSTQHSYIQLYIRK